MFQGQNTVILNQATICEAIEEYLNHRLLPSSELKVSSVVQPGNDDFRVIVQPARETD